MRQTTEFRRIYCVPRQRGRKKNPPRDHSTGRPAGNLTTGKPFPVSSSGLVVLPFASTKSTCVTEKTKVAARIQYELGCKPVDNEESRAILQLKQIEAQKPKHTLKIVDHHQISGVIQQGSAAAQAKFGSFVVGYFAFDVLRARANDL